jgi:hypothetical protein
MTVRKFKLIKSTALSPPVTVPYSTSMTPDASSDNFDITATNGTAFTVNAPTGPRTGHRITITIRNSSGGALGAVTWNSVYKLAAWTQPANGFNRSITFLYSGSAWYEISRTASDVPN